MSEQPYFALQFSGPHLDPECISFAMNRTPAEAFRTGEQDSNSCVSNTGRWMMKQEVVSSEDTISKINKFVDRFDELKAMLCSHCGVESFALGICVPREWHSSIIRFVELHKTRFLDLELNIGIRLIDIE